MKLKMGLFKNKRECSPPKFIVNQPTSLVRRLNQFMKNENSNSLSSLVQDDNETSSKIKSLHQSIMSRNRIDRSSSNQFGVMSSLHLKSSSSSSGGGGGGGGGGGTKGKIGNST